MRTRFSGSGVAVVNRQGLHLQSLHPPRKGAPVPGGVRLLPLGVRLPRSADLMGVAGLPATAGAGVASAVDTAGPSRPPVSDWDGVAAGESPMMVAGRSTDSRLARRPAKWVTAVAAPLPSEDADPPWVASEGAVDEACVVTMTARGDCSVAPSPWIAATRSARGASASLRAVRAATWSRLDSRKPSSASRPVDEVSDLPLDALVPEVPAEGCEAWVVVR